MSARKLSEVRLWLKHSHALLTKHCVLGKSCFSLRGWNIIFRINMKLMGVFIWSLAIAFKCFVILPLCYFMTFETKSNAFVMFPWNMSVYVQHAGSLFTVEVGRISSLFFSWGIIQDMEGLSLTIDVLTGSLNWYNWAMCLQA